MEILITLLVIGYLIGATPFSLLIGKWFYKIDLREHGSGNIGTTNTFRVLGKKAGIIVLIFDMMKGFIPVLIAILLEVDFHVFLPGLSAALGHVYPIFLKFRGGKAVATSAGAVLAYHPLMFFILLAIFLLTLKLGKMVSLSSIICAVLFFILSLIFWDPLLIGLSFIISIVIIVRHRSNIKRIIDGTESKITFM
ncbi:glycerol-3-phosphate 1-O-acyltransferase PlsY [Salinicoccus albus]|uniref:glycerol-3-phosphate 1-O-acyltransferase PlsY n=1 Tax=Salinicoccus albus TaxID=418756 RepID=UPI00036FFB50|nr:glycerol-3-phosphate 1-O-acyltransferase PlsY [Salinicoccus albus]